MSKVTKAASVPAVAAKAAKEATSSVVTIAVLVLLAVFVVIPMLPSLGEATVRAATGAAADGAKRLGDHALPLPARRSGLDRDPTTPPTTAAPRPYGPPNGPVRPLPSQLPPPSNPSARGNLPELGQAGKGGVLGEIPAVGPSLEAGVRAIGPGLAKALGKG